MYQVGQVLYLILNKKQQVIPAQVVEQIVRRTLSGEMTLHSVKLPTKESLYKLEELDAEIYHSPEDVQKKLRANALSVIEQMVTRAEALAKKTFEIPGSSNISPPIEKHGDINSCTSITLENGTVANVYIPDVPTP
jgi:hypothetical protein